MEQRKNDLRPALFLDRDGVLNEDLGYVYKPEDLRVLAGVASALAAAKAAGFQLLVISNQSGVARGLFKSADVDRFNADLNAALISEAGVGIDAFFYCPHHPQGSVPEFARPCACRKPEPGLIHQALDRFAIDLPHSFFIGDKPDDMECAFRAGVTGIQVKSRYGERHPHAIARVESLALAMRIII